jgi:hypothetical protein
MPHPDLTAEHEPEPLPSDCIFQTIIGFVMPFFHAGAGGDPNLAQAAIFALIEAYNAATLQELDLVGRIISFSTAAMDDLHRSASDPTMSDTKILRYRSNAVALNRSAEHCRKTLDLLQASPVQTPRPRPAPIAEAVIQPPKRAAEPAATRTVSLKAPAEIETMKLDARAMIQSLHAQTGSHAAAQPFVPDPFAAAKVAAHAALTAAGITRPRP